MKVNRTIQREEILTKESAISLGTPHVRKSLISPIRVATTLKGRR